MAAAPSPSTVAAAPYRPTASPPSRPPLLWSPSRTTSPPGRPLCVCVYSPLPSPPRPTPARSAAIQHIHELISSHCSFSTALTRRASPLRAAPANPSATVAGPRRRHQRPRCACTSGWSSPTPSELSRTPSPPGHCPGVAIDWRSAGPSSSHSCTSRKKTARGEAPQIRRAKVEQLQRDERQGSHCSVEDLSSKRLHDTTSWVWWASSLSSASSWSRV
ncbi:proline-rich receptor-like protein kinase PERK8 isoform X1 [Triticum aestivum]|uniref:proline-rich receptor-like protein kinase PERK8 isoform X1 n=1 Tax=Triticum aestivum TaxID=4565 RepID=UPI001D016888|nr:proline-rich receptor-like protein kinase PERK8 isoform X1 [Triticum aestivum]XP_044388794.1 proline-rich receptor-like protein kinase PERK8 isoform X1 [Triticum aestivum]